MANTFSELIEALGGTSAFASAIGMKPNSAKMAKSRDSLSPVWFPHVVRLAQEKGQSEITMDRLFAMSIERRTRGANRRAA